MGEIADMMIEAEMNDGWISDDVRVDPTTLEVLEIRDKKSKKKSTKPVAIGDKVTLKGNPYDEQIADEMKTYANVKAAVQTVTEVKDVRHMAGTSGWWIKTDVMRDWTSIGWFKILPKTRP